MMIEFVLKTRDIKANGIDEHPWVDDIRLW
jgi:hypothetical protein